MDYRSFHWKTYIIIIHKKILYSSILISKPLYHSSDKTCISLTKFSFLKQHLGASGPETADVEALKLENTELRQKIEQLTEENNDLKTKVDL